MSSVNFEVGLWPVSPAEYHADKECLSHSQLECFRKSPALYYGRYVSHEIGDERSESLDLGTVAHEMVLRPEYLDQCVAEIPPQVLSASGSRAGNSWKQFVAENDGKILLKRGEMQRVYAIAKAVLRCKPAKELLDRCPRRETPIRWTMDGVDCRALMDANGGVWACDLKTTRDPTPKAFATACERHGYARQAAWYRDGLRQIGEWTQHHRFAFIAVGTEQPHDCMVYMLGDDWLQEAEQENLNDLARWKRARESGNWSFPCSDSIVELSRPKWASFDAEWELGNDD